MKRLPVLSSRMATYDALASYPPTPARFGDAGLPPLSDGQGRRYTYARISLTDRCDMACVYCMPPGGEEEHALRDEQHRPEGHADGDCGPDGDDRAEMGGDAPQAGSVAARGQRCTVGR